MRSASLVPILAVVLMLLAVVLPGPRNLAPPVSAGHSGELVCPSSPEPVHDGVVEPGEYSENFFDSKMKVLMYFKCSDDAERTMHVAIVSPWQGWTELRLQTIEAWTGDLNVVRLNLAGSSVEAVDGYQNGTNAQFADDVSLGGSDDVIQPAARRSGDLYVYEFGVPLLSPDTYDSQLSGNGPFYFQLAYVTLEAHDTPGTPVVESEPHVLHVGSGPIGGTWTSMELSLPPGNEPLESAEILVTLRDSAGVPLPFKPVSVFAQTVFGFLELGTVYMNDQGSGSVHYAPRDEGVFLVGAAFEGGSGYLASVAWLRLVVTSPDSGPTYVPRSLLIVQSIIVLVLGGVWGTYAYSVHIVRRAMRTPEGERPRRVGGLRE